MFAIPLSSIVTVTGGTGGAAVWGTITGLLSDQLDLQAALDAKLSSAGLLAAILAIDGSGSGIDADLLDGQSSAAFALSATQIATQQSLTGGGNLSATRTLNLVNDVTSPTASQYYGTNASSVRGWYNLPAGSAGNLDSLTDVIITTPSLNQVLKYNGTNWVNDTDATGGTPSWGSITGTLSNQTDLNTALTARALTATQVATQFSLTGGGDLSATRTLNLVNDVASPGNTMLYGTNGSGVRGWYAQPTGTAGNLDSLTDVIITTPSNTQVLTYNGTNWVNAAASGGSVRLDQLLDPTAAKSFAMAANNLAFNWVSATTPFLLQISGVDKLKLLTSGRILVNNATDDTSSAFQVAGRVKAGQILLGEASINFPLAISHSITTAGSPFKAIDNFVMSNVAGTITSVTMIDNIFRTNLGTTTSVIGYRFALENIGGTVESSVGFIVTDTLLGTSRVGFRGQISSGSIDYWNFYLDGTAHNHISGNLLIGSTTESGTNEKLQVTGTAKITGALTLSTALTIANGGTGQISANAALNALLPSQATHSGKVLTTDGTNTSWVIAGGGAGNLDSLTDVIITTPSNGQVLSYNGTNWVNAAGGAAGNLDSLTDVVITTAATNDILRYNGTNWINIPVLGILSGGTGQTTANAALNALLPTQAGNANKFLKTDASNTSWQSIVQADISDLTANETIDHSTVSITTQHSLTGGGDLTATRTINLVGDIASPTASQYYGTNASSVRGWYNLPGAGGGGDNITVNTTAATDANFSDTTPIAAVGGVNVTWQKNTATPNDISAYISLRAFADVFHEVPFYASDFLTINAVQGCWIAAAISSGTFSTTSTLVDKNHPGCMVLRSSTTANSGVSVATSVASILLGGSEKMVATLNFLATSGNTLYFGFADALPPLASIDGAYIQITGTTLDGRTRSSSTGSTTGTTYTITTGVWYQFEVELNSNATLVTFRVLNMANSVLWSDTLSTNIPTGAGRFTNSVMAVTNSGTTATSLLELDYMALYQSAIR